MQCHSVIERLSEYLEHELPPREQTAVAEHLADCERCRAEAVALERAEEALRLLSQPVRAPELTADLRRRIAAPVRSSRWVWAGAAAALAVGAIAFLALRLATVPAPSKPGARQPTVRSAGAPAPNRHPERSEGKPDEVEDLGNWTQGGSLPTRPPVRRLASSRRSGYRDRQGQRLMRPPDPEARTLEAAAEPALAPISPQAPPAAAEPAPAQEIPDGVVLVLGDPQPVLPSSSYFAQVTLPDGETSTLEQTIHRDAAGAPRAVRISYQQTPPPTPGAEWRLR